MEVMYFSYLAQYLGFAMQESGTTVVVSLLIFVLMVGVVAPVTVAVLNKLREMDAKARELQASQELAEDDVLDDIVDSEFMAMTACPACGTIDVHGFTVWNREAQRLVLQNGTLKTPIVERHCVDESCGCTWLQI